MFSVSQLPELKGSKVLIRKSQAVPPAWRIGQGLDGMSSGRTGWSPPTPASPNPRGSGTPGATFAEAASFLCMDRASSALMLRPGAWGLVSVGRQVQVLDAGHREGWPPRDNTVHTPEPRPAAGPPSTWSPHLLYAALMVRAPSRRVRNKASGRLWLFSARFWWEATPTSRQNPTI